MCVKCRDAYKYGHYGLVTMLFWHSVGHEDVEVPVLNHPPVEPPAPIKHSVLKMWSERKK